MLEYDLSSVIVDSRLDPAMECKVAAHVYQACPKCNDVYLF